MDTSREIKQLVNGIRASDGDGVQLTRVIGTPYLDMLDPFLLLDAFGSDKAQDYIGGFPNHPHRGFETVTYMLAGKMRHKDSAGNEGVVEPGGVQWMTAGRGIIHSEMPEQEEGLLAGFQLWVNLPAKFKMIAPQYQERTEAEIPQEIRADGTRIRVIAGQTSNGTKGVIENKHISPTYWDVHLPKDKTISEVLPDNYTSFVYLIDGQIEIGRAKKTVTAGQLAVLETIGQVNINATTDSRFLLIGGKPLKEPVARNGPFVMNTTQEIYQAFQDYQMGRLA